MKDTDYRIAQSETEWIRYGYEHMGVRKSAKKLCAALNKSIRKKAKRAVRNVSGIVRKVTFTPSYDEKKKNIVVCLTTTPGRIRHIFPTIASLARQTMRPDLIVLWLGEREGYPPGILSKIEKRGICIRHVKDLGPNTKYHYAFETYQNDLVITVDDDMIYDENMIGELKKAHLNYPDLVVARRVHKIRFERDRKPSKYHDWIWEYRDADKPSHDLFATGVGGVLYPPQVMALDCWKNTDFLKVAPGGDDLWLKFCELSCNVKVCAVIGSGYLNDVEIYGSKKDSLSSENIGKNRNDEYIRSCMEYFGMMDDLCERMLAEGPNMDSGTI